jgi:hypothetical protein
MTLAGLEPKMDISDSSAHVRLKSTRETTLQLTGGPYLSMLGLFPWDDHITTFVP